MSRLYGRILSDRKKRQTATGHREITSVFETDYPELGEVELEIVAGDSGAVLRLKINNEEVFKKVTTKE